MAAIWRRLVEGSWAGRLAAQAGLPRARLQQQDMDMERLALCTRLWQLEGRPPSTAESQQLLMQVQGMSCTEHREAVAAAVEQQIVTAATLLHEELVKAGDGVPAATAMTRAHGILFPASKNSKAAAATAGVATGDQVLDAATASSLLQQRLGFTLEVRPSHIQHPAAGLGVFMKGKARVGSVVAIVPGLVYRRTQLARMPNYPHVSRGNDLLSSRYDMTILDSAPWGRQPGTPQTGSSSSSSTAVAWALSALERRHPLAWGHMVNHPASGTKSQPPNVLEVAWDLQLDVNQAQPWLTAYLPVLPGLDIDESLQDPALAALLSGQVPGTVSRDEEPVEGSTAGSPLQVVGKMRPVVVRGLALVATRNIHDAEELLLNYRLNPNAARPEWYHSVDVEEEKRRWAPLAYARLL